MIEDAKPVVWTPERRRLQSRIISRRLKETPWTPEQNAARAEALRGQRKSIEARAAMYASRVTGIPKEDAHDSEEWSRLYNERLAKLRAESRWDTVEDRAKELELSPEDVKLAIEVTFAGNN